MEFRPTIRPDLSNTSLGGTILFFYADGSKVFVAADSRFAGLSSRGQWMSNDDGCKIISIGTFIFFYSGPFAKIVNNTTNEILFSANQEAEAAFGATQNISNRSRRLFQTAKIWGELAKQATEPRLSSAPKDEMDSDTQLGGFAGLDQEGVPRLELVNMNITTFADGRPNTLNPVTSKWPVDARKPFGFGGGGIAEILEFERNVSPRAKRANQAVQGQGDYARWIAAVESAIKWLPGDLYIG